ncbi:MAG: type II toxin-antitoxin system HicA family toxin [Oscillospiraceae bacterium]|nr:type II toxin-antitoxin system HicA family toxin [Oscillospiraceae bacterium]
MNKKKLLLRIMVNKKNVKFNDFVSLVESFGFVLDRIEGSHRIYIHPGASKILNLQNDNGEAKPYQIKQFLEFVEKYNLKYNLKMN